MPAYYPQSYRWTDADRALLEQARQVLAGGSGVKVAEIEVLRAGLRSLVERKSLPGKDKKNPGKSAP